MRLRLKILPKILMLLSMLAIVSLTATVYCTWKMRLIDDTYGSLIDGPGRANLAIARANRNLIYVDRSIYRLLLEETPEGIQQAKKEISDFNEYFHKQIRAAIAALPDKETEISEISTAFNTAVTSNCAETLSLAASVLAEDKKKAATLMRTRCDPAINETMVSISQLTNRILKINDDASEAALAVTNSTIRSTYILSLGGLAITVLLVASAVIRLICKPLLALTACMKQLAAGDDEIEISGRNRFDEIGFIANAVETFRQNSMKKRQMELAVARERAENATKRQTELEGLAAEFQGAVENVISEVGTAVSHLEDASAGLSTTASSTGQLSEVAASASTQALTNVRSVAAATEELTGSIKEIANQVLNARKIADTAVQEAEGANLRINELSQASGYIGSAVKMIAEIAEQTNMLALNATIEAARAGEAGRGFAVVAAEVKALSSQTAKATEEIGVQINGIQYATNEAVQAIRGIGETITQMSQIAGAISDAVEEQGITTTEISRNIHENARESGVVASNIAEVSKGAHEAGVAADQVLHSARSLASQSDQLRVEVSNFLNKIQAA